MSMIRLEATLESLGVNLARLKLFCPRTGNASANATTTNAGIVRQAAAQANSGAAPTQTEFNNLLQKLRDAGILAP